MIRLILTFLVFTLLAPDTRTAERYFPPGTLSSFEEQWYGIELQGLDEAPLFAAKLEGSAFRLTVLPSFKRPRTWRLDILPNGTATLVVKEGSGPRWLKKGVVGFGPGTVEPGTVVSRNEISIGEEAARDFAAEVERSGFWSMPSTIEKLGLDGTEYILEAASNGKYHVVSRWEPGTGPLWGLHSALVLLANK